jgi:hypothetical protein
MPYYQLNAISSRESKGSVTVLTTRLWLARSVEWRAIDPPEGGRSGLTAMSARSDTDPVRRDQLTTMSFVTRRKPARGKILARD